MSLKIKHRPSPNFNRRRTEISMLVFHYTGMDTAQSALDRLCDENAQVSAHYVVEEDGSIWQLVEERARAWHAGQGSWHGQTDINSSSIGIEIVNGGYNFGLPEYPDTQIKAVISLSKQILSRQDISSSCVLGHSDMAPERKLDPGEHFPWQDLAKAGIGIWPDYTFDDFDSRPLDISSLDISAVAEKLEVIGYSIEKKDEYTSSLKAIIAAFQRRWRANAITGLVDEQTLALIDRVARLSQPPIKT